MILTKDLTRNLTSLQLQRNQNPKAANQEAIAIERKKTELAESIQNAAPGAFASTDRSSRSKKPAGGKSRSSDGKSTGAIDHNDRSEGKIPRSTGKSRTSKPATIPGAVTSSSQSSNARRERRKTGKDSSSKSNRTTTPLANNDAVNRKLQAADLLDEENGQNELQPKSLEPTTINEEGELLIIATDVDENEGTEQGDWSCGCTRGFLHRGEQ